MSAIYNEIDGHALEWLGNLRREGHIAPGRIDGRPIEMLTADDVRSAHQFHAFAGIGVWSHALRAAGWPDDEPVWTGSCPCQPFSDAGKRGGFDDERHLWPTWFELIRECRPPVILGEQVANPDSLAWLDVVLADLEGAGYACAAFDLCAAGVGAPHRRQRLYFVAVADSSRERSWLEGAPPPRPIEPVARRRSSKRGPLADADGARRSEPDARAEREMGGRPIAPGGGEARSVGDAGSDRDREHARELRGDESEHGERSAHGVHAPESPSATLGVADDDEDRRGVERETRLHADGASGDDADGRGEARLVADAAGGSRRARWVGSTHGRTPLEPDGHGDAGEPGPVNGFWRDAEWVYCRPEPGREHGCWRPTQPGVEPLAHGAPGRVGKLRAYGNAIAGPLATEFVRVVMEARGMASTPCR